MKIQLIEVNQPIGTFYISKLPASVVLKVAQVVQREYDPQTMTTRGGVQRVLNSTRVSEIADYTEDPDATFPTPIIIAIDEDADYTLDNNIMKFDENEVLGEIIDGQHRIEGIKKSSKISEFDLPITFMFDLTEEEKAYVFSIINSKQTKVPKSLIYDLFFLSEERSPQKTCHELARLFNSDERSPFLKRLKMLGRKEHSQASLSQGSFIKYLIPNISKKPDEDLVKLKLGKKLSHDPTIPLRYYFINNEDNTIYKILSNYFEAVKNVFEYEWNNPEEYILSKTTGYGALMLAFKELFFEGEAKGDLSVKYFKKQMIGFKERLNKNKYKLTSNYFPSNEQQQKRLYRLIVGK